VCVAAHIVADERDSIVVRLVNKESWIEIIVHPAVSAPGGMVMQTAVDMPCAGDAKNISKDVVPRPRKEKRKWAIAFRRQSHAVGVVPNHVTTQALMVAVLLPKARSKNSAKRVRECFIVVGLEHGPCDHVWEWQRPFKPGPIRQHFINLMGTPHYD
jgi:hypothetical protein